MGRRRLVVYGLLALPLVAIVAMLALGDGGHAVRASPAYLARIGRACARVEQASAGDPQLPPHFAGLAAYVERRLLRARQFRRAIAPLRPPRWLSGAHAQLVAAVDDEVRTLAKLRPAVRRRNPDAIDALIAHFRVLNVQRDRAAAWLGLADCVRVSGADARLAYPGVPTSARALRRDLSGICADSSARSAFGHQLIDAYPAGNASRRAAHKRFSRQIRLRLRALATRLGAGEGQLPGLPGCAASA